MSSSQYVTDDSYSLRSQFYFLATGAIFKICVVSLCLFIVSASDGSGTGGPGAVPGVILGAGFSSTTRDETGELLTVN